MKRLVKIGDKMIYVTGDKHRNFNEIKSFVKKIIQLKMML